VQLARHEYRFAVGKASVIVVNAFTLYAEIEGSWRVVQVSDGVCGGPGVPGSLDFDGGFLDQYADGPVAAGSFRQVEDSDFVILLVRISSIRHDEPVIPLRQ
jgi:hypothetical protein